jgi:hypothetical protein
VFNQIMLWGEGHWPFPFKVSLFGEEDRKFFHRRSFHRQGSTHPLHRYRSWITEATPCMLLWANSPHYPPIHLHFALVYRIMKTAEWAGIDPSSTPSQTDVLPSKPHRQNKSLILKFRTLKQKLNSSQLLESRGINRSIILKTIEHPV